MQCKYNAVISEATKTVSVRHRVSMLMNTASQNKKQNNAFVHVENNVLL